MIVKRRILTLILAVLILLTLAACGDTSNTGSSSTAPQYSSEEQQELSSNENKQQETPSEDTSQPASADFQSNEASSSGASAPEGDIVDGKLATKENPVPFGNWAAVTISDGGWPKPAYVRMVNVITDQTQVQALIDDYDSKNPGRELLALEEHAEFLDYVVMEYELFFPADFTTSEVIRSQITLSRENNQEKWIASDGSNYYWMGSVNTLEVPTKETGYPKNGDIVKCSIIYPMIKGNTDYTLHYKERTEDLSETIDTYFAVA